jgi:hypothetical protein
LFTQFSHVLWNLLDTTAEIAVMLRILKNVGFAPDGVCFESRDSMCRACHISKSTWKVTIESLQQKQLIEIEENGNKPHFITLHKNISGVEIRTRNINNIYRGSISAPAIKRGEDDKGIVEIDREPFKVVEKRIERFQDARNAIPSQRDLREPEDE